MDAESFIDGVLPFRDKVFRFLKRLCNNRADAEDMTQEVLMKLWARRDELSSIKNMEAFVLTVAKNHYLDKQKGKVPVSGLHNSDTENVAAYTGHSNGELALLGNIIAKLPEQQRMVLHLRDVEGMAFEDIAVITGMTINHLRVVLSRARGWVRSELTKLHSYGIRKN